MGSTELALFETAVVEIAGNVIEHGTPPGRLTMLLDVTVAPDELVTILRESGDPLPEAPPYAMPGPEAESGRGLPLCAALLDTFGYSRRADANVWEMRKRLSP